MVDLDVPREPGQATGAEALAGLCAEARQPCPWSTFTVSTPSGGQHLYIQAPAHPLSNSAGRLAPRIDIRAEGGYVVAPGSQISGRAYARRHNARPMPLPDWLGDRLRPQSELLPGLTVATCLADAARQSGLPEDDIPRIIQSGMTAGARYPRVPRQDPPPRASPRRPRLPRDGPPPGPRMAP